eukprot:SAG22_NODE_1518_length_4241_cov_5.045147_3_plen_467_part_00
MAGPPSACSAPRVAQGCFPTEDGHPVVDCRPLFAADASPHDEHGSSDSSDSSDSAAAAAASRAETLQHLKGALLSHGYFYARMGELLPLGLVERAYAAAAAAHALPREEVLLAKYTGKDAPYRGFSDREPSYDARTESTVRSWDFGRDVPALPPSDPDYEYCGPNVYPDDELPQLRGVIDELYAQQDKLAVAMFTALAEMFGLPSDTFAQHFSWRSSSSLRLLFYPGAANADGPEESGQTEGTAAAGGGSGGGGGGSIAADSMPETGISPHTDYEMFTLMHQNAAGLQIIPAGRRDGGGGDGGDGGGGGGEDGGGWIDLPVRPAEFVVIVGDMLERYTNGLLKATPHRVLLNPWPRHSIIRFTAVNGSTVVAPLPQFVQPGQPPAYSPVRQVQHVLRSLKDCYDGVGSWDAAANPPHGRSRSANMVYTLEEHQELRQAYNAQARADKDKALLPVAAPAAPAGGAKL